MNSIVQRNGRLNVFRMFKEDPWKLSEDPFHAPVIPRFRHFGINVSTGSGGDHTEEFVTTLKAIHKVQPPSPVKIPKRAKFFDWETVSEFELQFSFARDPQYQNIRNFMVSTYQLLSGRYLPFTLCRRNIKCPVHIVHQIWSFLTKYGLINWHANIDETKTKPEAIVPTMSRWPELIYTPNDKLYTLPQYEKRVHPNPQNPNAHPVSQFWMMACPRLPSERGRVASEVPGVMTFSWTKPEMSTFGNVMKEAFDQKSVSELTWSTAHEKVRTRSAEECAAQASAYPCSYSSIEQPAGVLRTGSGDVHTDMRTSREIIEDMVLSENPDMRVVCHAIRTVGNSSARSLLAGDVPEQPQNSDHGAAILALQKIASNAEHMKRLHKQRILTCMDKMVSIMRESIAMKRAAIEQAKSNRTNEM